MKTSIFIKGLAIATLLGQTIFSQAQSLKIGMPAPSLKVGEWIKGGPIDKFKPGQIYVVEFWATWCKPCIAAIPDLTRLAKKYEGKVQIIGIAINEQNTADVAPFVKKLGNQMDYHIGIDQQDSPTAKQGYMSKNWLAAAQVTGIPFTIIVGKTGLVEYIGAPNLHVVLPQMIEGTWTVISDEDWLKSPLGIKRTHIEKLLRDSEDWDNAIAALDEYVEMQGAGRDMYPKAWGLAQKALASMWLGKNELYFKTIRELYKTYQQVPYTYLGWQSLDRAEVLNNVIVWPIVDPETPDFAKIKPSKDDYLLALQLAQENVKFKPDDMNLVDSRAWAFYHVGDYKKAEADFEKIKQLAPDDELLRKSYELFKSKMKVQN